jgi:hypothetical protein
VQLAGSSDDVLRLLGLIGVPAKSLARLDLEDDWRRLVCAVTPIRDEGALPANCIVAIPVDLCARQVKCRDRLHAIPFTVRVRSISSSRHDNGHGERRAKLHVPDGG